MPGKDTHVIEFGISIENNLDKQINALRKEGIYLDRSELRKYIRRLKKTAGEELIKVGEKIKKQAVSNFEAAYEEAKLTERGSMNWRNPKPHERIQGEWTEFSILRKGKTTKLVVGVGRKKRINRARRSSIVAKIQLLGHKGYLMMEISGENRELRGEEVETEDFGNIPEGLGEFGMTAQPTIKTFRFWRLLEWGGQMYPPTGDNKLVMLIPNRGKIGSIEIVSVKGGRDSTIESQGNILYFVTSEKRAEFWTRLGAVSADVPVLKGWYCFGNALKAHRREITKVVRDSLRKVKP